MSRLHRFKTYQVLAKLIRKRVEWYCRNEREDGREGELKLVHTQDFDEAADAKAACENSQTAQIVTTFC